MTASQDESLQAAFAIAYAELHRMAARLRPGDSVTPSVLVHEAYLRLIKVNEGEWSPLRVRAVAAKAMRSVLIDRARRRQADKRGGGMERVTLTGLAGTAEVSLIGLNEALDALGREDPEALQVVELRFFGGLSNAEVAETTGMSLRTVERRWRAARALLKAMLQ